MIEIEQKYHVDDVDSLHQRLIAMGADEMPVEQHADTYYNHPSRDFSQTKEALRVRRKNGVPLITYKGAKLPGAVKARQELEWRLDPGDPDGTQTESLLVLLGFRKVATVEKSRRNFSLDQSGVPFKVTIDHIEPLGDFAEIELVVAEKLRNDSDTGKNGLIATARQQIVDLAPKLGLHRAEPRSYLRMLLESPDFQPNN